MCMYCSVDPGAMYFCPYNISTFTKLELCQVLGRSECLRWRATKTDIVCDGRPARAGRGEEESM